MLQESGRIQANFSPLITVCQSLDTVLDLLCKRDFLSFEAQITGLSEAILDSTASMKSELQSYAEVYQRKEEKLLIQRGSLEKKALEIRAKIQEGGQKMKSTEEQKRTLKVQLDQIREDIEDIRKKVGGRERIISFFSLPARFVKVFCFSFFSWNSMRRI